MRYAAAFLILIVLTGRILAGPSANHPCCQELGAGKCLSDQSVYQLTSQWTNDLGEKVQLRALRGKVQVVAMFYSSCFSACPLLVHQMQELSKTLPPSLATNVSFLLVTFDPERDTPSALHAYRASHQLPSSQWTLLQGSTEDVRELALVLGIKYRRDADGQFSHSNVITVLNADGEIACQQTGLGNSPDALLKKISALVKP